MSQRVIALFLAFVLLWSGLATIEVPRIDAQEAAQAQLAWLQGSPSPHEGAGADVPAGSVQHHHLDDLPSQPQSDPPAEACKLLAARAAPSAPLTLLVPVQAFASSATRPPVLAGLLRPPCRAVHAA